MAWIIYGVWIANKFLKRMIWTLSPPMMRRLRRVATKKRINFIVLFPNTGTAFR